MSKLSACWQDCECHPSIYDWIILLNEKEMCNKCSCVLHCFHVPEHLSVFVLCVSRTGSRGMLLRDMNNDNGDDCSVLILS